MESPEQAREESPATVAARPKPRGPRIGPVEFVLGFLLAAFGVLLLLSIPMMAMFSEGIPEPARSSPGLYYLEAAGAAVASIVAGVGLLRGVTWARLVAIALCVVAGLATAPPGSIVVGFGIALVLAARWRTE